MRTRQSYPKAPGARGIIGLVKSSSVPFDSEALRANLATTAQEVVIPDRYLPLLEAVDGLHGVRSALAETMGEYFHTFRNAALLVDGLQTTLLRNWSYFERSPRRAELFGLLAELAVGLLDSPLTPDQFSLLLRALLTWATDTLAGRYAGEYDEALAGLSGALARLLPEREAEFLERDTLVRNLTQRASERPELAATSQALFRELLAAGYRRVHDRLDVPAWALSQGEHLTDPGAVAGQFAFLTRRRLTTLLDALRAAPDDRLLAPTFPVFSTILAEAIDALFRVENLEDRFAVCLFFLKDETLGYRQKEVMADLLGVVKQMMQPDRHTDAIRILARLTEFFRDRDNEFLLTRFACYEAIGVAIGEAGNVQAADHLIEDILYWKFQYPDIRGATDDWETVVNPYHLPKVRCWMRIIESNPALFERLAAALNVQLKLGGVFIADTDLFQRDVTRFLGADIRPIYFVAKQLLRTLPVYFNEVGAEGELRAVSTQIDEICGRRDTLMHFLRKQVHAESSNRMVPFSRAVLRYWLTLDPAGLEPYVSTNTLEAIRDERAWAEGPHEVLAALAAGVGGGEADEALDGLLALTPGEFVSRLGVAEDGDGREHTPAGVARRRVALLVRTHQLLARKYSLAADDVGAAVAHHLHLGGKTRHRFEVALARWQARPGRRTRDALLDTALTVLEQLKAIILGPGEAVVTENIYQKRHIAAGIPSIYGNYSESRFDALGLSFRVENLVGRLLDDVVAEGVERYVTRASLRRMATALRRFERALAVDGVDSRALDANLDMLEASFSLRNFTFRQYQNVFQFLSNSVTELSSTSVLSHEQVLHAVLVNDPRQCEARGLSVDAVAELVLREVLVSGLGLQALDRYMSAALRQISMLNGRLDSRGLTRMMNYDPERLVSPIHTPKRGTDDQTTLGFKGLGLKQMASYGHRVPEGFVLSTELFGAIPAMSYPPLYDDTIRRVQEAVERARAPDRPAPRGLAPAAAALHPLRRGDLHARPHDHVRQRRPQRRARRGVRAAARDVVGRLGQLPSLPPVLGDVLRHRPRLLRRDHDGVQVALRRGAEARLHRRPDARDRVRLQVARPRPRRGVRRRAVRPGGRLHAQGAGVLGFGPRARVPPVHRGGRGVGHGRGHAAHGLRQPQPRVGLGRHLHQQPARAAQRPGPSLRGLRRAQPGRGPGRAASCSRGPSRRRSASAAPPTAAPSTRSSATSPRPTSSSSPSPATWSGSASSTRRRSSSPSSRRRRRTSTSCRSARRCRSRPATPPTSTPRRPTTARRSPSAWASPAARTRVVWRSTPSRSTGCWPRLRRSTSSSCARTPCRRTSA